MHSTPCSLLSALYALLLIFTATACGPRTARTVTPWGEELGADTSAAAASMETVYASGELIAFTLSGPEGCYDWHGAQLGTRRLAAEAIAQRLGLRMRMEVCRDSADMMRRLAAGEGDMVAWPVSRAGAGYVVCGAAGGERWAVAQAAADLADTLRVRLNAALLAEARRRERLLTATAVTRHVYAPVLDRGRGIISRYDALFQRHAPRAGWDWRLLAAQCYQESAFDPAAHSWAGAVGLMQIVPSTGAQLGIARQDLTNPEQNVAAAVRYIAQLNAKFADIAAPMERRRFVLAAYNGGYLHIRDAQALARKHGKSPARWADVAEFVLKLQQPAYYRDPVVRHGYMRGSETTDYVERIERRWQQYRGFGGGAGIVAPAERGAGPEPQRARRKYKF